MTQFRFNIMFNNNSWEDLAASGNCFPLYTKYIHFIIFTGKEPVYKNGIICNFHQFSYLLLYDPTCKNLHYQGWIKTFENLSFLRILSSAQDLEILSSTSNFICNTYLVLITTFACFDNSLIFSFFPLTFWFFVACSLRNRWILLNQSQEFSGNQFRHLFFWIGFLEEILFLGQVAQVHLCCRVALTGVFEIQQDGAGSLGIPDFSRSLCILLLK